MATMTITGQTFEVPEDANLPTEMGPNPYFPDEDEEPEQETAPASDDQAGDTVEADASEDGGSPDPTFDPEQDAANGIDVEDPMYQRLQAAFVKRTQGQAPSRNIEAELDELKAQQFKQEIERETKTAPAPAPENMAYQVDWSDFKVSEVGEDSPIHGVEAEISKQIRQHVEYAVKRVNQQNAEFVQQQKLAQTRDYLTQVVEEIGQVAGPSKKQAALALLKEYLPIAKADPVKWARFAVNSLGITVPQEQPAAASATKGDPQRVARQVKGAATRPTRGPSGSSLPRPQKGASTRDVVAWALDQQMK